MKVDAGQRDLLEATKGLAKSLLVLQGETLSLIRTTRVLVEDLIELLEAPEIGDYGNGKALMLRFFSDVVFEDELTPVIYSEQIPEGTAVVTTSQGREIILENITESSCE